MMKTPKNRKGCVCCGFGEAALVIGVLALIRWFKRRISGQHDCKCGCHEKDHRKPCECECHEERNARDI